MKYDSSLIIDLPRTRMLQILEDPEGMQHWQDGLISYEFLDEDRTAPGARMRLEYDMNGRQVVMTETLVERSLPDTLIFTYEAKGVWNRVVNRFNEESDGSTRWTQENEFRCKGFLALICLLAPGSFRKETASGLQRFKVYAENLI